MTRLLADGGIGPLLQNLAKIRAGYLLVDSAAYGDLAAKIEPLAGANDPWRHSAREILGLSAYRAKDLANASKWFEAVVGDKDVPQPARQRAELMLQLIAADAPAQTGFVTAAGCPSPSRSSAARMSASRRFSTVWLARSWRSSTTRPASRATAARRCRASMDLKFRIIDTAGLEEAADETLQGRMRAQTEIAIDEADLTLFVVDAKMPALTPATRHCAEMLRRSGKPGRACRQQVGGARCRGGLLDACDARARRADARSRPNMARACSTCATPSSRRSARSAPSPPKEEVAVTDVVIPRPAEGAEDDEEEPVYDETKPLRVAIVGRPNAGKSTLINRLIGEDRLLTGPEAGITRDSISVDWDWRGRTIKMFDTAGMRRKARVIEKLEKLSVADGLRAIRFAEMVVIVLRRHHSVREAGSADRRSGRPRRSRRRARLQQVGPDRGPPGSRSPISARRPSVCCRRCAASAPCRSPARPARGSTG